MRKLLQAVGSLWLAAVILLLLMIAMGAATVYETNFGTPAALAHFYKAAWFQSLLALLAINAVAAIAARYPWRIRQVGFLCTHGSILLILIGAWITHHWGIDGQVVLTEGQAVTSLTVSQPALRIEQQGAGRSAERKLSEALLTRAGAGDFDDPNPLRLDEIDVRILQYFTDSQEKQEVLNDNPQPQLALEVAISSGSQEATAWVFPDQAATLGKLTASLRVAANEEELNRLIAPPATSQPAAEGSVTISFAGQTATWPLAECTAKTVPIPGSDGSARVLQYLPHAIIDTDRETRNASNQPINPAVQVELHAGEFTAKKWAFSKFPSFWSETDLGPLNGLKVVFAMADGDSATEPIQLISGPQGQLYARFEDSTGDRTWKAVTLGQSIATPWPNVQFETRRQFDHARMDRYVEAVDPPREDSEPAIGLEVIMGPRVQKMLLPKSESQTVSYAGKNYTLHFGGQTLPLNGRIVLDQFVVGRYPGTQRPRSFESHVRFTDGAGTQETSRVISMNHPATFGSYNFYQSSYRQDVRTGKAVSFLSASWDPGLPIVFAGYAMLILGMAWVLVLRSVERRRTKPAANGDAPPSAAGQRRSPARKGGAL